MEVHNNKAIWFVIFLTLLFLVANFIFTQYEFLHLPVSTVSGNSPQSISAIPDDCGATCKAYINSAINQAMATYTNPSSPAPTTSTKTTTPTTKPVAQITYVPLSGGNTQNTDWTTITSSQFNLNIGDYGSKPYAIWDANLRVDNANGTTFARLFDTTHSIAVNGSEIKISDTSSSTDVVSGSLSFWAGNNTYVVQVKSLNSSTAFIDSGRIKISY